MANKHKRETHHDTSGLTSVQSAASDSVTVRCDTYVATAISKVGGHTTFDLLNILFYA